jgi:sugar/nucleoside kinase (ribokinase family)
MPGGELTGTGVSRIVRAMVWVVGAVGIDMIAMREKFLDGTSNPSDIRFGLGGVGHRIFTNLDVPKRFVTALGTDPISRWAREILEEDGNAAIQEVKGRDAGPPLYLALMESGNLKVAASDFRIVEQALSAEYVERIVGDPGPDDFLVLDANLSPALIGGLLRLHARRTRVVFEPVSVEKALRHADALRDLFLLTPTAEEADALSAGDALPYMAERNIHAMLVTRGSQGATLFLEGRGLDFAATAVVEARDTTGAGDLLLALLVSRLHRGEEMAGAVRSAMSDVEERLGKGSL